MPFSTRTFYIFQPSPQQAIKQIDRRHFTFPRLFSFASFILIFSVLFLFLISKLTWLLIFCVTEPKHIYFLLFFFFVFHFQCHFDAIDKNYYFCKNIRILSHFVCINCCFYVSSKRHKNKKINLFSTHLHLFFSRFNLNAFTFGKRIFV